MVGGAEGTSSTRPALMIAPGIRQAKPTTNAKLRSTGAWLMSGRRRQYRLQLSVNVRLGAGLMSDMTGLADGEMAPGVSSGAEGGSGVAMRPILAHRVSSREGRRKAPGAQGTRDGGEQGWSGVHSRCCRHVTIRDGAWVDSMRSLAEDSASLNKLDTPRR